jgi:uncharacterized Zn-finger protein
MEYVASQAYSTTPNLNGHKDSLSDCVAPQLLTTPVHKLLRTDNYDLAFLQENVATQQPPVDNYFDGNLGWLDTGGCYHCRYANCPNSYTRYGELTRHNKTIHEAPFRFQCHFDRCPRGINGQGFARKDKLVNHLKSKKHKLSAKDAAYAAAMHNPPRR